MWGFKYFVCKKYTFGDSFVKISVCMYMFVWSFVLRFNGPVISSSVMSGSPCYTTFSSPCCTGTSNGTVRMGLYNIFMQFKSLHDTKLILIGQ